MTFADKLIKLRKINGMSQETLADELGVSRQAISKWEGMLSVPDLQNVLKISELFGVTTDYLLKDSVGEEGKYPVGTARTEKADCPEAEQSVVCDTVAEETAVMKAPSEEAVTVVAEREEPKDKAFAIAAGVFMLATPVATVLNLFFGNAVESRGGVYAALTIITFLAATAAGVLAILSAKNRKLSGVAFCLILVQSVASVISSALNTSDVAAILNIAGGVVNTLFAILAVTYFYSKHKIRTARYALLALPSVGAVYSVLYKAFLYDYSGNSATTMAFGFGYVAFILMAAIIFRENGYEKKRSENLGLAAVALLALSLSLSVFYLLVSLVLAPAGEVVTALYVYGYVALYVAGFVLLPWIACYTCKKPLSGEKSPDGYVDMTKHVLLTAVTALVWHYIWVYSVSLYLNAYAEGKKIKAGTQLLRYIFVPFYYIYWFNKHGHVISRIEEGRGEMTGKLHPGMMIFACLVPFAASVVMQNRINAIALSDKPPLSEEIVKPVSEPACD